MTRATDGTDAWTRERSRPAHRRAPRQHHKPRQQQQCVGQRFNQSQLMTHIGVATYHKVWESGNLVAGLMRGSGFLFVRRVGAAPSDVGVRMARRVSGRMMPRHGRREAVRFVALRRGVGFEQIRVVAGAAQRPRIKYRMPSAGLPGPVHPGHGPAAPGAGRRPRAAAPSSAAGGRRRGSARGVLDTAFPPPQSASRCPTLPNASIPLVWARIRHIETPSSPRTCHDR